MNREISYRDQTSFLFQAVNMFISTPVKLNILTFEELQVFGTSIKKCKGVANHSPNHIPIEIVQIKSRRVNSSKKLLLSRKHGDILTPGQETSLHTCEIQTDR